VSERPPLVARWVALCADRAWLIAAVSALLGIAAAWYSAGHFAMTTDTADLLSPKLAWRIRENTFNALFRPRPQIVVVVDGETPEQSEAAASLLAARLRAEPAMFHSVRRPDAGPFWSHNGLLYAATGSVRATMAELLKAQPLLGPMAADPSLRGLMAALSTFLKGVSSNAASLEDLHKPIQALATALEQLRTGRPGFFSWRALIRDGRPDPHELRHVILTDPRLQFDQLEAGKPATEAIRAAVRSLKLDPAHGVRVRLTGMVRLQDEELSTLGERAPLIAALALGAITLMLWMAVRSVRLIAAILLTTLLGLIAAVTAGLLVFTRFNVISVAVIPLFVGLGIDFGIQVSVRYRAERTRDTEVRAALVATGRAMGRSLCLAATAIAVGFFAFTPTDYTGVSQLGTVAGLGMFIALTLSLTLLPALIQLTRPPGVSERNTDPRLARIDAFVLGHRRLVVGSGCGAALVSLAVLPLLHFDFNPMHMRSPKVESVATLLDLTRDPDQAFYMVEVVSPSLAAANELAARFRRLPQVLKASTLSSFVPDDQAAKIAIIADTASLLDLALNPIAVAAPASDAQVVASLDQAAANLDRVATGETPAAADARRLASELHALSRADAPARKAAANLLIPGLTLMLSQIRDSLQPQRITLATLPPDLVRDWLAPDGRARLSVVPRGDPNDNAQLSRFVDAGLALAPDATGAAPGFRAAGRAMVGAFIEAGVLSFIAITALLFVALRRLRDVAITMAPIVLTGLLTMGSCVLIGQPLNFANIIALPLLFGIGVAFHIYFVMSWRSGGEHLLTSSLARAVFFSALATATGFGSLWASSHPGTASMGKLLMISLVWTLVSALLFQPALMGQPPATGSKDPR
jgi:hopanoid biosynthesis associated RND transporter like protein HpnN